MFLLADGMSHSKLANLTPNLCRSHYFGHYKVERSDPLDELFHCCTLLFSVYTLVSHEQEHVCFLRKKAEEGQARVGFYTKSTPYTLQILAERVRKLGQTPLKCETTF